MKGRLKPMNSFIQPKTPVYEQNSMVVNFPSYMRGEASPRQDMGNVQGGQENAVENKYRKCVDYC